MDLLYLDGMGNIMMDFYILKKLDISIRHTQLYGYHLDDMGNA